MRRSFFGAVSGVVCGIAFLVACKGESGSLPLGEGGVGAGSVTLSCADDKTVSACLQAVRGITSCFAEASRCTCRYDAPPERIVTTCCWADGTMFTSDFGPGGSGYDVGSATWSKGSAQCLSEDESSDRRDHFSAGGQGFAFDRDSSTLHCDDGTSVTIGECPTLVQIIDHQWTCDADTSNHDAGAGCP